LFGFAAAEKRHEYLWLLRAFDRGRANYQVLMHASDTRAMLAAEHAEAGRIVAVGGQDLPGSRQWLNNSGEQVMLETAPANTRN
jgi:hypothetical protein